MHTLDLSVYPVTSTLKMLASLLERITTANDKLKQSLPQPEVPLVMTPAQHQIHTSFTRFHARSIPSININAYLTRILKYCPCANECFLSLLVYFDRMARNVEEVTGGEGRQFSIDSFNIHRLIIAGIMVSAKYFSDVFFTNSRYAKVGGLPVTELNQLEVEFLTLNNFALAISIEELQTYGDQLMKHWMCEEVARREPSMDRALTFPDQFDGDQQNEDKELQEPEPGQGQSYVIANGNGHGHSKEHSRSHHGHHQGQAPQAQLQLQSTSHGHHHHSQHQQQPPHHQHESRGQSSHSQEHHQHQQHSQAQSSRNGHQNGHRSDPNTRSSSSSHHGHGRDYEHGHHSQLQRQPSQQQQQQQEAPYVFSDGSRNPTKKSEREYPRYMSGSSTAITDAPHATNQRAVPSPLH